MIKDSLPPKNFVHHCAYKVRNAPAHMNTHYSFDSQQVTQLTTLATQAGSRKC